MQAAYETFFSVKTNKQKKLSEHIQRKGIKKNSSNGINWFSQNEEKKAFKSSQTFLEQFFQIKLRWEWWNRGEDKT